MTTSYDYTPSSAPVPAQPWPDPAAPRGAPHPVPQQRHPGTELPPPSRIGHPRPARDTDRPLFSGATDSAYPLVVNEGVSGGRPRRGRSGVLALVLVLALGGVVGWQAWRLDRLDDRLTGADRQLAAALAAERARAAGVEARTAGLEQQAGRAFDSEAIAAAVLPSVFRVRAGSFTGTAFAVGDKAGAGRTNLLTNFHVVESVWEAGDRRVKLERGGVDVSATLIKVDKGADLALLRMDRAADGLATAGVAAKAGQPIVVVGAPLGLEDTVTTGVISAFRKDDGDGPRIQFDAPINPGNSGGPVINSAKQVVGLATAKARNAEGIGLAIPIKTACAAFDVC